MKRCPNCQTVYTDETLRFCLNDGATLTDESEGAAATVQMPPAANPAFDKNQMRVNIAHDSVPTYFPAPQQTAPASPPANEKSSAGLIVGGIAALLLLLTIGGLAAFFALRPADNKNAAVTVAPPPAAATPTAAPTSDETAKLKEQLANLQKQVQDQKNKSKNAPAFNSAAPVGGRRTARANSPGDGFLALRSAPDAETGARLAKIPHGARFDVLDCPKPSNAGKTPGRWCQVIYEGQAGWAFDAFMVFD